MKNMADLSLRSTVEAVLRELAPQVLGAMVRRFRDFAATEDAVQEALLAAALQWPRAGLPQQPRAWLTRVAARRMIDHIRSESARRLRESDAALDVASAPDPIPIDEDDTLGLLFLCCHPALSPASAIALTLRAVGGLTTAEIARAFLVPEATMAQRISRAKQTIKASGIGFQAPEERTQRLSAVLHVVYLMFNEGYTAGLPRDELAIEAIRLGRLLHERQPEEREAAGLLALMLLTQARRQARMDADGQLIPLAAQDRTLWDRRQIGEGTALLAATLPQGAVGPYQLQAAIAAVHDEAARAEDTDWPQILALYDLLRRMSDNPVVRMNHAVAAAMVYGPAQGLELLADLDQDARLAGHPRLQAVRAHLLEMSGAVEGALIHFREAAAQAASPAERSYLARHAAELEKIIAADVETDRLAPTP